MEKWTPQEFVAIKEICKIAEKAGLQVCVVEIDADGLVSFPDNDFKTYQDLVKFIFECDGILIEPKNGGEKRD